MLTPSFGLLGLSGDSGFICRVQFLGMLLNEKTVYFVDSPTRYTDYSCGGRIRTCDLQVMSLASYQLLHSAMLYICIHFLNASAKVDIFL